MAIAVVVPVAAVLARIFAVLAGTEAAAGVVRAVAAAGVATAAQRTLTSGSARAREIAKEHAALAADSDTLRNLHLRMAARHDLGPARMLARRCACDEGLSARSASQAQPLEPGLTTSTVSRWIGFEHAAEE